MKFAHKLLLDRLVGSKILPVVSRLKSLVVKPSSSGPIIVTKIIGLGSLIQATPLLSQLKREFPYKKIILLTSKNNTPLTKYIPYIDEVITIDDGSTYKILSSTILAIFKIRGLRPSIHIDLEVYSNLSAALTLVCGAARRVGLYRVSPNSKQMVYTDLIFFNTNTQIREIYLKTCTVLTQKEYNIQPLPVLDIPTGKQPVLDKYIVVNVNASDLLLERRWPNSHFITLINKLTQLSYPVVLTGGKSEVEHVTNVFEECAQKKLITNLAGKLSFTEFLQLLKASELVITNDTGPMHIAAALRTPVIALWGPGNPNHYGFIPEENVKIVSKKLFCSPCLYEVEPPPCKGNNICMQSITPNEVFDHVITVLNSKLQVPPLSLRASEKQGGKFPTIQTINPPSAGVFQSIVICPFCAGNCIQEHTVENFKVHKCQTCGSRNTFPQPSDMDLEHIYGAHYYSAWGSSKNGEDVKIIKQNMFNSYAKRLKLNLSGASCLDCGAATGHMMQAINNAGGTAFGLEINPAGIEALVQQFGENKIFCGQMENIEANTNMKFDYIFMFDYIEHVRDPLVVLQIASKLLNPEGKILGTTPNGASLSHAILRKAWPHLKPEHLTYPSKQGFEYLTEKANLSIILQEPNRKILPPDYILSVLQRYNIPILGTTAKWLLKLAPTSWLKTPQRVFSGEILFVFKKK